MSWYPIAFLPPQIGNASGVPYSGAVLKAYAAGTSTPIAMATDVTGATLAASIPLNASGYPAYLGTIIIPHLAQDYKMALYPNQAAADANSGAIWTVDNIQIAASTNTPFIQYFDGDGVNSTFTLSEDLGNDETILMVFADRAIPNYVTNGAFAADTDWTKGTGWTIGAGVATATGAISTAISQNANTPIVQGQSYTVEFTVTASAGTLTPSVGGNAGTTRGAGTWRETIIAGATQVLAFTGAAFTGTLDNASIKPTYAAQRLINRPDEYTLVGNQLTLNNVPPTGTKNVIVFAPSLLLGAAAASAAAAATSEINAANANTQVQATYAQIISSDFVLYGTSATSLTIGTGSKVFTTQAGKQWVLGQRLRAASNDGTMIMEGEVTDYTADQLTLNVDYTEGAGTHAVWNIGVAGARGSDGAPGANGADGQPTLPQSTVALSSLKTVGATNNYLSMSGNTLSLTPGRWKLEGSCYFGSNGSTPSYFDCRIKWASANGADSSTEPADIDNPAAITMVAPTTGSGRCTSYSQTGTGATALNGIPAIPAIVDVSVTTSIYLVPYIQATNPTNARVQTSIIATPVG